MKINVVAFGIARSILGGSKKEVELEEKASIGALRQRLTHHYPELGKLNSLRFAVNEDYRDDSYTIDPSDEIVIIPPVSGG